MHAAKRYLLLCWVLCLLLCTACTSPVRPDRSCTVLFADHADIHFTQQVYTVDAGDSLTATVTLPANQILLGTNQPSATIMQKASDADRNLYEITFPQVRYSLYVTLEAAEATPTLYHIGDTIQEVQTVSRRLRPNTLPYDPSFARAGQLAIGWNTQPDGSGQSVGFGSRIAHPNEETLHLYATYLPTNPESEFTYKIEEEGAVITHWGGAGNLIIPDTLHGSPVVGIAADAFQEVQATLVCFPPTLQFIEEAAFQALATDDLYFFDTLQTVSETSFGALQVKTLHIHAATTPVYCGSYFDSFSEKMDYLDLLQDEQKLILFCGSSARFGYDSGLIEAALPPYRVINMGVFAYANMLPQGRIVEHYLRPGDIVLSSPELDAIDKQFCGQTTFDSELFAMMESNYDLLTLLDLREFTHVFDGYAAFQKARSRLSPRSYEDVPSSFDEDGHPSAVLTYNRYGDYILHRGANIDDGLFGVKRAAYDPNAISEQDWHGLNALYDRFAVRGARVLFTYSPRSERSITPESTPEAIHTLDALFRQRLHAQVISPIQSSLLPALYFAGTDNHLSSEGVQLHTKEIIHDLQMALEVP